MYTRRFILTFLIYITGSFILITTFYLLSSKKNELRVKEKLTDFQSKTLRVIYHASNLSEDVYNKIGERHIGEVNDQLSVMKKVRTMTKCFDRSMVPRTQQRGDYWVLYNYVLAERSHSCHETITYTTHADFTFLDNLVPVLERWKGPISVALHAPGSDFNVTLDSIAYLRDCTDPLVKELVTFHIYFDITHIPKRVPKQNNLFAERWNCSSAIPFKKIKRKQMYKTINNLLYPINVGRNVARETAQTHFVFACDIEHYPSVNLIPQFFSMIAKNESIYHSGKSVVFPLPNFEVKSKYKPPENKTALLYMMKKKTAQTFHRSPRYHNTPKTKQWLKLKEKVGELEVFHVAKRKGIYAYWEPFYIGTHLEPYFDERLTWEGKSDKLQQAYAMCALDYDYAIMNNAFLVHKPGLYIYNKEDYNKKVTIDTKKILLPTIAEEMKILFGNDDDCVLFEDKKNPKSLVKMFPEK